MIKKAGDTKDRIPREKNNPDGDAGSEEGIGTLPRPRRLAHSGEERTSVLLRQILEELGGEFVTAEQILARLRRRSFGGVLIVLTIAGMLPILSFFAGLVVLIPAFQMATGRLTPSLPSLISKRRLRVRDVRTIGAKVLRGIEWLERYVKPRWLIFTLPPMPMLLGIIVALLGIALTVPVPMANLPPAVALLFLSLGLIERDGVMIAIGLFVAVLALIMSSVMALLAFEGVSLLLQY